MGCSPFLFQKCLYMVESTGKRARNLRGFYSAIRDVEPTSIFCHLYLPLMGHHIIPPEYLNDFTYWIGETLKEKRLAEEIMSVKPESGRDIESFRSNIMEVISGYIGDRKKMPKVPAEEGFYFNRCVLAIYPTGHVASNLKGFVEVMEKAGLNSIFYHFFVSPMVFNAPVNDFSAWIAGNLGDEKLAEGIEGLDPYGYDSIELLRTDMIKLMKERIGGGGCTRES
jgi:hypothetical protein